MSHDTGPTRDDLLQLKPRFATFVGIDSDGCVFDTMEIKQKQCFHSVTIEMWHLEKVEKQARECLEFANLYSTTRGTNRFPSQVIAFELLRERPEVRAAGVHVPDLAALRRFVQSGRPLSNAELARAVQETGDPELKMILDWSTRVNERIARTVKHVPPFEWARRSIEKIAQHSDILCVSQTPYEALAREWGENDLSRYARAIAGQELGTKAEHIEMATRGRYQPNQILMIGDAPGDKKAAKANKAHFYPINPLKEEASWERFHKEAYDRFLNGTYGGAYEEQVIAEFEALLPARPPWMK